MHRWLLPRNAQENNSNIGLNWKCPIFEYVPVLDFMTCKSYLLFLLLHKVWPFCIFLWQGDKSHVRYLFGGSRANYSRLRSSRSWSKERRKNGEGAENSPLFGGFQQWGNDFFSWLVVSNILIFHSIWDSPSHWLSYFSRWLKPPTIILGTNFCDACFVLFSLFRRLLLYAESVWLNLERWSIRRRSSIDFIHTICSFPQLWPELYQFQLLCKY